VDHRQYQYQFDLSPDAQRAANEFRVKWFVACTCIGSTPWLRELIDRLGFNTVSIIVWTAVYHEPWKAIANRLGMERHMVKRMAVEAAEILAHETLKKPGPKPVWREYLRDGT